jgi:hypothetical protein
MASIAGAHRRRLAARVGWIAPSCPKALVAPIDTRKGRFPVVWQPAETREATPAGRPEGTGPSGIAGREPGPLLRCTPCCLTSFGSYGGAVITVPAIIASDQDPTTPPCGGRALAGDGAPVIGVTREKGGRGLRFRLHRLGASRCYRGHRSAGVVVRQAGPHDASGRAFASGSGFAISSTSFRI